MKFLFKTFLLLGLTFSSLFSLNYELEEVYTQNEILASRNYYSPHFNKKNYIMSCKPYNLKFLGFNTTPQTYYISSFKKDTLFIDTTRLTVFSDSKVVIFSTDKNVTNLEMYNHFLNEENRKGFCN